MHRRQNEAEYQDDDDHPSQMTFTGVHRPELSQAGHPYQNGRPLMNRPSKSSSVYESVLQSKLLKISIYSGALLSIILLLVVIYSA
jgi:hypothetical protein